MATPDFMPVLRQGAGATPADGGCLVQIASFLADGESWTDTPDRVDRELAKLAIIANDRATDADRQALLVHAPRLLNTDQPGVFALVVDTVWDYHRETVKCGVCRRETAAMTTAVFGKALYFQNALQNILAHQGGRGLVAALLRVLDAVDVHLGRAEQPITEAQVEALHKVMQPA